MTKRKQQKLTIDSNEETKTIEPEIQGNAELSSAAPLVMEPFSELQEALSVHSEVQEAPSHILRPTGRRDGANQTNQTLIMLSINTDMLFLSMFAWIAKGLVVMAKIAISLLATFFFSVCLNWEHGREFWSVIRTPTPFSYSKMKDSMFSWAEVDRSYHVTFKVTDSSFANAVVLFEVTYPILLRNPFILGLVLLSISLFYYLLSLVHRLLLKAKDAMNAELLDRAILQESPNQP